ncbi:uncharacterized protein LOC105431234 isoform X2 [Pogonomyrmex barbatus]|uniref:Uncharacterized protein LOC105431234 isoform X2 n=1 Tax=Pogonomyrmex barbatus TaxID=144034 RepID=A0A6I9WUT8_9HYME|nr:uncharacterized protein LOC105431234 isoform X2 [Pogonomyrmex barbatus]
MAKNHKRLKRLKSEKAKVKLKAKKSVNQIPKSLNITNTSFKVKKILLPEQLKHRGETEIGICKSNINDLLTRFRHYNSTVREDALKQLKNILLQNSKSLHSQLSSLLRGIAALSLDKEKNFPYGEVKRSVSESKRRQEDFSQVVFTEKCLVQNLGLCQIHVWFTSLFDHTERFCALIKNNCESVATYLNGVIENSCDSSAIPQLTNLLRVLFLKASPVWYVNCINLSHTLQLIIEASSSLPNKELQSRLCLIVGDIMLENNLNELHREKVFKNFVKILPSLLLRSSINDVTIRMISQIVLRFKDWIQEELVAKHEAIIENAKKIVILNSHDDRQSRLMIYNLFYFIDSQIYY